MPSQKSILKALVLSIGIHLIIILLFSKLVQTRKSLVISEKPKLLVSLHFRPKELRITPRKRVKVRSLILTDPRRKIKPEIQKIYNDIGVADNIKMKSSLKFCVVAAGEYDGYVAEPRAYEWDIAAGHAILVSSGGTITDFNGNEILYGKKDLKNPSLILKSKNIL